MLCFLVTFNIIIYYIFPKIPLKFFTSSILTIFVNCLDFFTFSCYKKTNVVSICKIIDNISSFLTWNYFR